MKILVMWLVLAFVAAANCQTNPAQYVDAGVVFKNVYANECLGFRFQLPEGWAFETTGVPVGMAIRFSQTQLLLVEARSEAAGSHQHMEINSLDAPAATLSLQKFVERSVEDMAKRTPTSGEVLREAAPVKVGDRMFYRGDVRLNLPQPIFVAFVATYFRGYFVLVQFSGESLDEMNAAAASLQNFQFANDQRNASCTLNPNAPKVLTGVISSKPTVLPGSLIRVSQKVSDALLIEHPAPSYPAEAREKHIEGMVTLKARITPEGVVEDLQLMSGDPLLAPAAMDAVRKWKYKPYLLNGMSMRMETQVSVNFVLQAH